MTSPASPPAAVETEAISAYAHAALHGSVAAPRDAAADVSQPNPPDPDITGARDLRAIGALPPVKNQGSCDASGIFAITDAMSAAWFAASGQLRSFSEQSSLDCLAHACGGAAADFVTLLGQITTLPVEAAYPYTAAPSSCKTGAPAVAALDAFEVFDPTKAQIGAHLDAGQVVMVTVPTNAAWDNYTSGVLARDDCRGSMSTIAAAIVGYDAAGDAMPYWIVRVSRGAAFGEAGHMRVARAHAPSCAFVGQAASIVARAP